MNNHSLIGARLRLRNDCRCANIPYAESRQCLLALVLFDADTFCVGVTGLECFLMPINDFSIVFVRSTYTIKVKEYDLSTANP